MAPLRNARATSAGGVVHRSEGERVEILLVHRRVPVLWALPKGTPDSGESIEETALRETREETGIKVQVEKPLGAISYFFVAIGHKSFNAANPDSRRRLRLLYTGAMISMTP